MIKVLAVEQSHYWRKLYRAVLEKDKDVVLIFEERPENFWKRFVEWRAHLAIIDGLPPLEGGRTVLPWQTLWLICSSSDRRTANYHMSSYYKVFSHANLILSKHYFLPGNHGPPCNVVVFERDGAWRDFYIKNLHGGRISVSAYSSNVSQGEILEKLKTNIPDIVILDSAEHLLAVGRHFIGEIWLFTRHLPDPYTHAYVSYVGKAALVLWRGYLSSGVLRALFLREKASQGEESNLLTGLFEVFKKTRKL